MKKGKKSEVRPVVKNKKKLKVHLNRGGGIRRKVRPDQTITDDYFEQKLGLESGTIKALGRLVAEEIGNGNDVVLWDGVRLYGCLEKDLESLIVCARTEGKFREAIKDGEFELIRFEHGGNRKQFVISRDEGLEVQKHDNEARNRWFAANITPDLVVECPKCKTVFRVGKKLG